MTVRVLCCAVPCVRGVREAVHSRRWAGGSRMGQGR